MDHLLSAMQTIAEVADGRLKKLKLKIMSQDQCMKF